MLKTVNEVKQEIEKGKTLLVAGEEELLLQLPAGNWIGGTIPYFMSEEGGLTTQERLFVTELPSVVKNVTIQFYGPEELAAIPADAPENGFSLIIIPAESQVHQEYAENAPDYPDLFMKPILGWVSGVHLSDLGKKTPKVFHGKKTEASNNKIVVMHAEVPENYIPSINIINLFKQGNGAKIQFPEPGFVVKTAFIDGEKQNFAEYIMKNKIDTKLPMVADYSGAMVNVSIQSVDTETGKVHLYAPVFPDVTYRFAAPVENYVKDFNSALPKTTVNTVFSCNCILNFLYSELEGKKTEGLYGPMTFGEVAYQLLNQTLVYLKLEKVD
ncbi:MAG: DUF6976 family protein [Spirochaetia bacterium]